MSTQTPFILKQLIKFHLFTSLAISLAASWGVTDLLLLKMDFDLARFGIIKGNMFLVPAVTYFLFSGKLGRMGHEVQICQWSYFLRAALPVILPLLALAEVPKDALLWITAGIMAVTYTCAMFANNTLLKIMRSTLPPGELNRRAVFLTGLLGLPGALLCIPAIWFLTRVGEDPKVFLAWFALLQTAVVLFEYPAIRAIGKIPVPPTPVSGRKTAFPFRRIFTRDLGMLYGITLLHGIWMGLCATYFVVYLLKNKGFSPGNILWIDAGLCVLALLIGPSFGKLVDRWGYPLMLCCNTAVIAFCSFLWCSHPEGTVFLILFIVLVHNGNNGFLAGMLRQSEGIASVRLPEPEYAEFAVGFGALVFALGTFAGCSLAGKLYTCLDGILMEYFRCCTWGPVVMCVFSAVWLVMSCRSPKEGRKNGTLEKQNR